MELDLYTAVLELESGRGGSVLLRVEVRHGNTGAIAVFQVLASI